MLHLLLVEDQESYVTEYNDVLSSYNEGKKRVRMTVCKSIREAKRKLDFSVDAAIVDLNLGKDTSEGGKVVDELKKHFRIPVAILTGTPDDVDEIPPVIRVFKKGEHGFDEVLDCLWRPYEIGLTRIMGGRGLIEKQLNKIFLRNLLPTLSSWIEYGDKDAERTEKALLRYALGHLMANLDDDETDCYPEEFYLAPPLKNSLTTGSMVRNGNTNYVVLTPACDLVLRKDGKGKKVKRNTNSIVLAEIFTEETVYRSANSDAKKALKNNNKLCFHRLPKTKELDGGFIDFRRLQTVPLYKVGTEFNRLEMRIAPNFIKDIVSRFSIFYARQGQPVVDPP